MRATPAGSGTVVVSAPAKINLSLAVGPVRSDGFHALATVYQAVGLYDRVTVRAAPDVTVTMRASPAVRVDEVPTDATNLAARAATLLARHHGLGRGAEIVIDKAIPVGGGMAGGSADAAAALVACDALWGLRTRREQLLELAGELGSDVPFSLVGGTAVGSGRGERLTPLPTRPGRYWWVVAAAVRGLATPEVYREFDAMHEGVPVRQPTVPDALLAALRGDDIAALGAALANDLQPAALRLRPELADTLERGRSASAAGAILSGSGPTCLFLCEGRGHAERVAARLRDHGLGPVCLAAAPVLGSGVGPG